MDFTKQVHSPTRVCDNEEDDKMMTTMIKKIKKLTIMMKKKMKMMIVMVRMMTASLKLKASIDMDVVGKGVQLN